MKRLILMGEIGVGKSTLIRTALGNRAALAGGFVTRRITEKGTVLGFDLAPAGIWGNDALPSQRFLDFTNGRCRNDAVFSGLGAALLAEALDTPFAVADEFGGMELLVPEFYEGLVRLLTSDVPVIGVLKTPGAVDALAKEVSLGDAYGQKAKKLRSLLEADPDTQLLPVTGWEDSCAAQTVRIWTETYARR